MAQERPNRLVEWVMLLRQNAPIAREHLKDWATEVRQEPRLLWETPAIRFSIYGILGLVITWGVVFFVGILTPAPPPGARDAAVTADFHVVCSNPDCGYNFVISRKFGFDDFPVVCEKCKKETGMPGRRCFSEICQGRWVAPVSFDPGKEQKKCPICGGVFPEKP